MTISQPKGYSMFCDNKKPDFEKMWRETQANFNKMEAKAIHADKLAEALREIAEDNPNEISDRDELIRCADIARAALAAYESEAQ